MILNFKKIRLITLLLLSTMMIHTSFAQKSMAEKLGYKAEDKLLIIHADDIGVAHAENAASIAAFEMGAINSGSIMVPCPWFEEIAAYSRANPEIDLGLHLTLTAEWKYYKWGPVAPESEVPGLLDENGYLYDNCASVANTATPEEVEKELRAQKVQNFF